MMNELFQPNAGPPYRNNPIMVGPPQSPIRVERAYLIEDWYACGNSRAYLVNWGVDPRNPGGQTAVLFQGTGVTVRDPAGLIEWELAAIKASDGEWYIPGGMLLTIWQPEDANDGHWELLKVGEICKLGSVSGSVPDRERPCELPPCPGSGLYVLMCRNGECATWQALESGADDDSMYLKKPTKTSIYPAIPAGLEVGEVWMDTLDPLYPVLRYRYA